MTRRADAVLALARQDAPTLADSALRYRLCWLAALDSLHAAYNRIAVLERMVSEMREERERYARSIFRVMESAE